MNTNYNRVFRWALNRSIWHLYGITALLFCCSASGGYYVYSWMEKKIAAEHGQLTQLNTQLVQFCSCQEKHKKNSDQCNTKQLDLSGYSFAAVPSFAQEQLNAILVQARKKGLRIVALHTQKEKKKDWYVRTDVQIDVKGTLEHINQFIAAVSQEHKLMQCKSITCSDDQQDLYSALCTFGCIRLI